METLIVYNLSTQPHVKRFELTRQCSEKYVCVLMCVLTGTSNSCGKELKLVLHFAKTIMQLQYVSVSGYTL